MQAQVVVLAEAKGLSFDCALAEDVPDVIFGDRYWLRQLMLNLISNAIKFTDKGSVGLSLFRNGDQWGFRVADTGPGIADEAQAQVFQPFAQGDSARMSSVKGIGLGLSIVQEVVALMNGDVTLESRVGEGTTFTVTLPLLPLPLEEKAE